MAADRLHHHHDRRCAVGDPHAGSAVTRQSPAWDTVLDRPQLITEVTTVVLCGPSALIVMVLVARHGWPPWWLVVAGMLLAWAWDALWTVGEHTLGVALANRQPRVGQARWAGTGERRTPDACPRRGHGSRAGDQP